MNTKTIAIVIDATNAAAFSMMLARLFNTVVNVRRAAHILEVVADLLDARPDRILYPSDIDQKLVYALFDEARASKGALRFVVIGCRGLTREDAMAVERRAQAA